MGTTAIASRVPVCVGHNRHKAARPRPRRAAAARRTATNPRARLRMWRPLKHRCSRPPRMTHDPVPSRASDRHRALATKKRSTTYICAGRTGGPPV